MKIFKYLALAGLVSLAACNNGDTPEVVKPNEGSTYAGMYISGEKRIASRSITDSQADEKGREEEGALTSLDLLSTGGNQTWTFGMTPDEAGKFWETGQGTKVYKVAPWKTTPGKQTMALVINKGDLTSTIGQANTQVIGTTATAKEDIKKLATDGSFVMTSTVTEKNVAPDKKDTDVKDATDEANNVFSFDLERVVAQGRVVKATGLKPETKDGKGTIDLDKLTYAAVNGATKTYLFGVNAGSRTMTDASGLYDNFKSAIDDYVDFSAAKEASAVADKLIRLGNLLATGQTSNNDLGDYKAIAVANDVASAKTTRGIYFLENSVDKAQFTVENKNFGFYRMAYAKVYAQFTPKEVYTWDAVNSTIATKTIEAGTTFYKGAEDNLLYDSKENAKKSTISPNQEAYTYTNGMCAYRALWNRQVDATTGKLVVNADARRNNIYQLTITEFEGLGMPWDPSDPKDPNLPKPEDDPKEDKDDPDIEKSETFMRVEATVLPWNLVSREVSLD